MSRALEQCADKLNVYSRSADSPAVVRELLSLNEEFCQCAISLEDMTAAMNNMEDGLLKSKLADISLVFSVYDSFVSEGWLDDSRMLTRLKDKILESGYFKNKTVFFDSFRGFTAQEFGVIGKILTQADDVYAALTAPDLVERDSDDIFYHTKILQRSSLNSRTASACRAQSLLLSMTRTAIPRSMHSQVTF